MQPPSQHPRKTLFRNAVVFQLKLLADGVRDAILIPVSVVAALIGLLRGGEDCDREFERVVNLGRRSELWINLFGNHSPMESSHPAGSMDSILEQVESVVREQYRKGRSETDTRAAVRKALENDSEQPPEKAG